MKLKLSFSTLGCPDWDFDAVMKNAQAMGYLALELRGVDGEMRAEKTARLFPENLEETQKKMREHGLCFAGFGTSVRFDTPDKYEEYIEEGKLAIDVCQRAGIPFIRVFGDSIPKGQTEEEATERIVKGLKALCAYGQGKGVGVYLEVHGVYNTAERILSVCKRMDENNFGIVWDVGHTDKIYRDDFELFYGPIRPWIRHVHLKDQKRGDGQEFTLCMPGDGDVPTGAIVSRMLRDGYGGWFSFEWEKKWHPEIQGPEEAFPRYIEVMRKIEADLEMGTEK